MAKIFHARQAMGRTVRGVALVAKDGFSARYDLDRIAGSLEVGFRHFPPLERAGIKRIVNGPFTFAPDGNPIVGYSKQKPGIRLMFWSGDAFEEEGLNVGPKKFKDASVFYNSVSDVDVKALKRWLKKSKEIQFDYKNIMKKKGKLERIT